MQVSFLSVHLESWNCFSPDGLELVRAVYFSRSMVASGCLGKSVKRLTWACCICAAKQSVAWRRRMISPWRASGRSFKIAPRWGFCWSAVKVMAASAVMLTVTTIAPMPWMESGGSATISISMPTMRKQRHPECAAMTKPIGWADDTILRPGHTP